MSGSAKAGTIAERHACELRVLPEFAGARSSEARFRRIFFSLTKTYMEVGNPSFTGLRKVCSLLGTHVHSPCVNVHQQLIGAIPHLGGQSCRDTSKMNCGHYAERLRVDR